MTDQSIPLPSDPTAKPPAPTLDAAEVQALKEMLARRRVANPTDAATVDADGAPRLPEIGVTEDLRNAFAEHLHADVPFICDFAALDGKLTASLRLRTKAEIDRVARQLDADYRDGLFGTDKRQQDAAASYNLRFQLVRLNGVDQDTRFPADAKDMTVRRWTQESLLEGMSEARLAVLLNWLAQFENLVARLWREALAPNFTVPAAAT